MQTEATYIQDNSTIDLTYYKYDDHEDYEPEELAIIPLIFTCLSQIFFWVIIFIKSIINISNRGPPEGTYIFG